MYFTSPTTCRPWPPEAAGVIFIDENGGVGPGVHEDHVRLRLAAELQDKAAFKTS
jgi:hypothetical protein